MINISLDKIIDKLDLEIIYNNEKLEDIRLENIKLCKISFENLDECKNNLKIDIISEEEINYLTNLTKEDRDKKTKKYFIDMPSVVIFSNVNKIPKFFHDYFKKSNHIVLLSKFSSDEIIRDIYLNCEDSILLKNEILLEIYGIGIMLRGSDEIIKLIAINTIRRGHRLISSNDVLVYKSYDNDIIGESLNIENGKYKYEIEMLSKDRFDLLEAFGLRLGRKRKKIDMIIDIIKWGNVTKIERLGLNEKKEKILGTYLPKIDIPYKKGRNVSAMIEAAALDRKLKLEGFNSAENFSSKTVEAIRRNEIMKRKKDNTTGDRLTIHGVFMEIYGLGVLITGKSGVGKSESALELITRGFQLIADDKISIVKQKSNTLIGERGEIPYYMEIRGIGIIDVKTLFGIGAVKKEKTLDLVVEIIEDENNNFMSKESSLEDKIDILGCEVLKKNIYINSGRNAATLIETVSLDYRSKRLGY